MKADVRVAAGMWAKAVCPAFFYLACRWALRISGGAPWAEAAGTGLLLAVFGFYRFRHSRPEPVSRRKAFRAVLLCGAAGLAAGGLIRLIPGGEHLDACSPAAVLLMSMLGPACEEIVYRGVVFDAAEKLGGSGLALVLSTALFACGHRTLLQMALSVPVGLILGMIRNREGNLLAPLAFHAALNAAALIFAAQAA